MAVGQAPPLPPSEISPEDSFLWKSERQREEGWKCGEDGSVSLQTPKPFLHKIGPAFTGRRQPPARGFGCRPPEAWLALNPSCLGACAFPAVRRVPSRPSQFLFPYRGKPLAAVEQHTQRWARQAQMTDGRAEAAGEGGPCGEGPVGKVQTSLFQMWWSAVVHHGWAEGGRA